MARKKTVAHIVEAIEALFSRRGPVTLQIPKSDEFYELGQAVAKLIERFQIAQHTIFLLNQQVRKNNRDAIMALVEALNAKDPNTYGHSERVSIYSLMLAEKMGLSSEEIDDIAIASYLHDIGKIGIPEAILNKPGRLTTEEFELIKSHPRLSCKIIAQIPNLTHIASMVKHHHERFDGAGYPDGLRGDQIPLGSKIIAIADSFDAMTSLRSYRSAFEVREALDEIKRCAGGQFDPDLAEIFVDTYRKVYGDRSPSYKAS